MPMGDAKDGDAALSGNHQSSFWERLGSPKFILGPMVDQSDLAFRLLVRQYGTDLCYTPMLHSRLYVEDPNYRIRNFQTCGEDKPLIAQFCGHDPETLGRAAELVAAHDAVNAVDINFGCPQGIAKRGRYGAYLLEEPDLMEEIVRETVRMSPVPVTCKIRKVNAPDLQPTLNLVRRLEAAGCAALCIHGRTIKEKGQQTRVADWNAIERVKQALHIPVIANGGIETRTDALLCLEKTGADAVMSAEGILEYPALFSDKLMDIDGLMAEYLSLAERYGTQPSIVKAHLFHSLYSGLQRNTDLRAELGQAKTIAEMKIVASTLRDRRRIAAIASHEKFGWYNRYRTPIVVQP